jgi:Carboxypeptidase regulatory-like domain
LISRILACVPPVVAMVMLSSALAFAQAATSSITGSVLDSAGGAIPGAAVVVKNESGVSFEAVSNGEGLFNIPGVAPGTYTVTVSLSGFKTAVIKDLRVVPGTPQTVKAVLEVGQLSETINVQASSELINTQNATVSSTLNADQLNRMPTPTRNALNAVTFLPGINTATTNRESRINGLPESFVSITLDGVSNNDNFLRSSDSFFASVTPRQDAIEAVNVTTAVQGATTGGSGAVSINFTTRSGSNKFSGSGYEYYRNTYSDWLLNTNYWFNTRNSLPKNEIKLNQYGARLGGPIVIPGLYDGHDKAFFFGHYEQLRFQNTLTRTRTLLNPRSVQGWFRYTVNNQVREVNVLDLARANGQSTALDPMMMSLINRTAAATQVQSARGTVSNTSDPLIDQYVWLSPGELFEHQPTVKIDYNLSDKHRLTGSYQIIWAERDPDYLNGGDVRFPGGTNYSYFHSRRPLHSYALRSTLSNNTVNEVRVGITAKGGASYFGSYDSNGVQTFADMGGYAIVNPLTTDWFTQNGPSWRSSPTYSIDESLTWQKGKHSFSFGGGALIANAWENGQTIVPTINIGLNTTFDPARGLFTTANFPGASNDQLSDARGLYAFLTGRVSSIGGTAALDPSTGKYVAFAPRRREGELRVYSGYAQDQWRLSSTLTLTGGLRYDLQTPFSASSDIMSSVTMADFCGISGLGPGGTYTKCNMFVPGASGGVKPTFKQLTKGTEGYKTDKNNFGPSISVAWRPDVQSGFMRTLLGDPDQATLRAGYTVSYERQGMGVFTGTYGANPGSTISLARTEALGNLVLPGESWPIYLSESSRIYPAPFNETPSYPIQVRTGRADSLNGFAPDLEVASAGTWTVSLQRAVSRNMAVEARYVGTRGWNQWSTLNYNAIRGESLINNHFLDEFRLGMANLLANNIAGGARAGSFAYFGPGTGTYPLPTYLAYLNASRDANNPSAYSGSNWTNTTFAGRFVQSAPNPVGSAGDLDGNSGRRGNAVNAGLPANFFVPNPDVSSSNVTDSGAYSDYHALQLELRRRLANGFSANVNYQYALEGGAVFDGFTFGRTMGTSTNVRHAIKAQWDWTLPVGRGHRFGNDLGSFMNAVLGGWNFNGVGRIQARVVDFGNVRLVGMSKKDLQKMYKFDIRVDPSTGLNTVYMLPDDVILNTRRAFSISSSTVSGYSDSVGVPTGRYIAPANSASCIQIRAGDCAPRELIIRAPWFSRFDIGIGKDFPIHGRTTFGLKFDVLNVFNNINFNPVAGSGSGATIFQTTSAYTDPSNTYDPGGRLGQIMFRINW